MSFVSSSTPNNGGKHFAASRSHQPEPCRVTIPAIRSIQALNDEANRLTDRADRTIEAARTVIAQASTAISHEENDESHVPLLQAEIAAPNMQKKLEKARKIMEKIFQKDDTALRFIRDKNTPDAELPGLLQNRLTNRHIMDVAGDFAREIFDLRRWWMGRPKGSEQIRALNAIGFDPSILAYSIVISTYTNSFGQKEASLSSLTTKRDFLKELAASPNFDPTKTVTERTLLQIFKNSLPQYLLTKSGDSIIVSNHLVGGTEKGDKQAIAQEIEALLTPKQPVLLSDRDE